MVQLAAGQEAEGLGASYVEGVGGALLGELGSAGLKGLLEIDRVGQVNPGVDVDHAIEPGLVQADPDTTCLGGLDRAGLGFLGVEPDPGLFDQPVEHHRSDPVGDRSDLPVHERRALLGEADGGLRDPAGPPRGQVTGLEPGLDARQPVANLDRLTEVGPAGVGGLADHQRELGHAELRHLRRTRPGHRQLPLPEQVIDLGDGLNRVHHRPVGRQRQQIGLGPVSGGTQLAGPLEHPSRGVEIGLAGGLHE